MNILLTIVVMLLSFPTGLLCYWLTRDEKDIFRSYFIAFGWGLALLGAYFLSVDPVYASTTLFMLLLVVFWSNGERILSRSFYKKETLGKEKAG